MRACLLCVAIVTALSLSSASHAATTYSYDTLGRLSTVSYDNGKQILYNYDPAGNRSSVVTQPTPPMHLLQMKAMRASKKTRYHRQ